MILRWDAARRPELLGKTTVLGRLPLAALRDLATSFVPRQVPRDELVLLTGELAAAIHLLAEGRLKVVREADDGREVILRLIRPGEVFGGAGLWGEATYSASAVAQADAVVHQLPVAALRALVGARPERRECLRDGALPLCRATPGHSSRRIATSLACLTGTPTTPLCTSRQIPPGHARHSRASRD